ncbi:hypothetical protein D9619_012273 [Psilocybe cf. subviscida]|uniref:Mitochondrial adapter protein MCP1 transmembrane domain-containing protein n=1 Tax=Psilocybe cf. subviscida TaxID=2480587 RepID=A0A8H5B7I9_9AGAR|nr:hypothetical protein D9619_012273 [Psilocybe cf. subviscida]
MLLDLGKLRARALPILTKTAHISAPFITTFLLIHLSAPAVASIGGSSLASSTMLLGREYYQTALGEPLLVLFPIVTHSSAGILKRLLYLLSSSPEEPTLFDMPKPSRFSLPRSLTSALSLTSQLLLLLLPIHYLTHRAHPTLDLVSIDAVGPSELDYEFVKTGLRTWPVRSWMIYSGLVGAGAVHVIEGMRVIYNTWVAPRRREQAAGKEGEKNAVRSTHAISRLPKLRIMFALLGIATPVLAGLYVISSEPAYTFASLVERYSAAFEQSFVFRI